MLRRSELKRRQRRGAQVVEFAVAAPIFFLLVLGMIELSRGMMVVSLLNNVARNSCRKAICTPMTRNQVQSDVNTQLSQVNINSGINTTVLVNGSTSNSLYFASSGSTVTVQVDVDASGFSWLPVPSFLTGTVRGQYTARKE